MKEREIRERIERVVHLATVSATLGVTISLASCGQGQAVYESVMPVDSYRDSSTANPPPRQDAAGDFTSATPMYTAQMPDAEASDTATPDATTDDSGDAGADQS
jgi:hypothetical protein